MVGVAVSSGGGLAAASAVRGRKGVRNHTRGLIVTQRHFLFLLGQPL